MPPKKRANKVIPGRITSKKPESKGISKFMQKKDSAGPIANLIHKPSKSNQKLASNNRDILDSIIDSDDEVPNLIFKRKNRLNDLLLLQQTSSRHEEDDGFVYKRKTVSTPVQTLNKALRNMSDESDDMLDLEVSRLRPSKQDSSLQLSSPMRGESRAVREEPNHTNHRRSSYYTRGKRILNIEDGVPHPDVPFEDYYKHLDSGTPEADRMRQVLVWCIKKKMETDDNDRDDVEDQTVFNIAKVIKEEVLQDLRGKRIPVSWYSSDNNRRKDKEVTEYREIITPNLLNLANLGHIKTYTEKLRGIIIEKEKWQDAHKKAVEPISGIDFISFDENTNKYEDMHQIVTDLEASKDALASDISNVETSVESLYHAAYQLSKTAELVHDVHTSEVQKKLLVLLNEYMKKGKWEKIDTRDLLRGLSRVSKSSKQIN